MGDEPKDPPAYEPVDPGEAASSYVRAMADPELQELILGSESEYGPQYVRNALERYEASAFGFDDQDGIYDLAARAAPIAEQMRADTATSQRTSDIEDVEELGGRATAALRASDPERARLLEQQQAVVDSMFARAGGVTPEQTRMAQQSAREAYGARGREFDNSSIFAEGLGREQFQRQNRFDALNAAGSMFAQYQQTAADPFQAILGRPSTSLAYNQASGQQALGQANNVGPALINPDAGVNLAMMDKANQANYNASVYGAQQARSGATTGGFLGALGRVGAAALPLL